MNDTLEENKVEVKPRTGTEESEQPQSPETSPEPHEDPVSDGSAPEENRGPSKETESYLCDPQLIEKISGMGDQLESIQREITKTREQISFLPPQLRNLGGRVDAAAVSISETRYRALLRDLLGVYDLVDQLIRTMEAPDMEAQDMEANRRHLKNYRVILTQLGQILAVNGLEPIPTDGPFNADIHKAVDRTRCDDPDEAGRVVRMVRPGFRTSHQVLRYAEVVVSVYEPAEEKGPALDEIDEAAPEPGPDNPISHDEEGEDDHSLRH
jgi:molecular chaperone GrpE (heat shock protein)